MNSIFNRKPHLYEELCARLDITERYEPAFRCRSRKSDISIILRPVCVPDDEELIRACTELEWTKQDPVTDEDRFEAEKRVLKAIAASNSGQTFLGLIDGEPVFLSGIHKALQYPVGGSDLYKVREEDYVLTLRMPPFPGQASAGDLSVAVLKACMTHYFSYSSVENLIVRIDKNDAGENELYLTAGFRILRDAEPPFCLYHHTGTGYLGR